MLNGKATIVLLTISSTRSKTTPKTALRTRNGSVQDIPQTSRKEINEDEK